MEYRIKDYTIKGQRILLPRQTSIEDLRLIFNETQKKLICSTATKDNVTLVQREGGTLVEVPTSICSLNSTDLLTIKCDYGDNLEEVKEAVENIDLASIERKVETESQAIQSAIQNVDLSSVESKVDEVKQAVENIQLPEIDTTELAKQGGNPEATNSKILDEVQKISSLDVDVLQGKIQMAGAITKKGVPTKYTDSLQDMAIKVGQIRQTINTQDSDWDEFTYPSEYSENAYRFVKDLIDGNFTEYPSYLSSYLKAYKQNTFWIGEFIIPENLKLTLSQADAYYTSDGHFYTLINGVVTHTLPNGTIETYESEVVEHNFEWDGSSNILVANIYTDNYIVSNYQNENLLGVIACGTCLGFSLLKPIYYITSLGEINNVSLAGDGDRKDKLIIRGLKYLGSPLLNYVNNKANRYNSVILPDLEELNSYIYNDGRESGSKICILPNLKINNSFINNVYNNGINIDLIFFSAGIKKLYKSLFQSGFTGANHINTLKEIHLPNLEDMNGFGINRGQNGYFARTSLEKLYMPNLKRASTTIFHEGSPSNYYDSYAIKPNLIDLEVGEVETNLILDFWTATNVLADSDKTSQLQNNIHNHIAAKVKDVSGLDPLTITFSQAVRNVLLPETEELFAAKNWNIAPTRTA